MKIALFGASSQIAKGLLREFLFEGIHQMYLFTRDVNTFQDWLNTNNFHDRNLSVDSLERFDTSVEFDLIINFIGIGDPAKAIEMGSSILDITHIFDTMAIEYLNENPSTKYLFLSSGAAYGSENFSVNVNDQSEARFKINNLKMKVTGQKLVIYDSVNDVSDKEILLIANYLYNEGFFKKSNIDVQVKNDKKN